MGGWGLINPGFLAAGAAFVAVPVLIHLLARRKAVRVDVGSLRFLKIAVRDNARRRKVRRWLLLAMRVAGALLLGLLFARPYRSNLDGVGAEREVAILIDGSASMSAGGPGKSAIDRARAEANRILKSLPDGTATHVALFDASGVFSIPPGKLDETAKSPRFAGTDFARGLAWARDRMVESKRTRRDVYLLTDLQRAGLERPPAQGFPERVGVEVIDVGRVLKTNLGVADVQVDRADIRPNQGPILVARVVNTGSFPAKDVVVRLRLDGLADRTETISLEGSSSREVRFSPPITSPGLSRGDVEVASRDDLPFDDRRFVAFEAKFPERILLVDGEPGATVYANETYYLEAALRLRLPEAGPSATAYEPVRLAWNGGSNWPDLAGTSVVVLANVAEIPEAVAESLRTFVEAGGQLVIFSGDRVENGAYASLARRGLLPAEVAGRAAGPIRFDAWEAGHPLLRPFDDAQYGDLRSILFSSVARLNPTPGSIVLASARGGPPMIVERVSKQGRVVQLAIAADNDQGDWSVHRLYLPVIHQMMGYLTNRLPGAGLIHSVPIGTGQVSGIESTAAGPVVRNPDPAESTLDRVTLADFRATLRLPVPSTPPEGENASSLPPLPGSEKPGEWWRWVAWGLLVILVAETFVANRTHA